MGTDRQGLDLTGSREAVAAYDRAIDHLIRFRPEVEEEVAAAVAADPGCVMGRVAGAYLSLMSTEERAVADARDALGPFAAEDSDLLPRARPIRSRVVRAGDRASTGWSMTSSVGLPVCRSLLHFVTGQHEQVLEVLLPIRTRIHEFGGSHAQRDAVERTLLEAAIRAGRTDLASALVSERLAVRECSTYAWSKRAFLLAAAGNTVGAAFATAREQELAGQIRSAAAGFGFQSRLPGRSDQLPR